MAGDGSPGMDLWHAVVARETERAYFSRLLNVEQSAVRKRYKYSYDSM